jgi:hypothetical protein
VETAARARQLPAGPVYTRRQPESETLHRLVHEHLRTLYAAVEHGFEGASWPEFVRADLEPPRPAPAPRGFAAPVAHCGGRMKLRALVRDPESIERFLRHQNLWTEPLGLAETRLPPYFRSITRPPGAHGGHQSCGGRVLRGGKKLLRFG